MIGPNSVDLPLGHVLYSYRTLKGKTFGARGIFARVKYFAFRVIRGVEFKLQLNRRINSTGTVLSLNL